ncbi:EAL domain-containing protein, partial [Acinetobacter baumannii]
VTESLFMEDINQTIALLEEVRALGCRVAIDDFGTGYSSLPRLRALPLDRIKLDRSLIEHIAADADARIIAQAVIGLIHGLGCQAVGEGVETQAQADILRI